MAVDYFAGNDYDIGIALQSAQGVAADDSQFRTFVTAGGVMPVKDTSPIEETSDERLLTDDYVSGVRAEGGPQIVVRPNIIGLLLYGAMGAKAVAGVGDPYSHTITLAKRLPYFTVWTRLGDSVDGLFTKIVDCKIGSLSLASSANGLLMATVNFLGTSPAHAAAAEATATIEAAGTARRRRPASRRADMTVEYFAGNDYDIGIALQSAQGVAASTSQFRSFVAAGGLNPSRRPRRSRRPPTSGS
jgi:hypothetical protein